LDIQVHIEETEKEEPPSPSPETSEQVVEVIEVVEEEPELPATASGRLASLREEMDETSTVNEKGSIEDRMKDFFGER